MMIEWKKVNELSDGHGVLFIYIPIKKAVAFVEGYEWFHGNPKNVVVEILENSSVLFEKFNVDGDYVIKHAKDTVKYFLNNKGIQNGKFVNEYFCVWFNA